MKPLVGIICCTRALGGEPAQAAMARYVEAAMHFADADAVLVPALPELLDADNVVTRLDGLLLTGSLSNVTAEHGGVAGGAGPFDPARDTLVARLIAAAALRSRPVFGICRGLQEINVALGGTLRDGLAGVVAHHGPDEMPAMFEHRHGVTLTPGGVLATTFETARLAVASVHYQAIDTLAPSLTIEARADDGLIEAVSGRSGTAPLLAIQWHPEWRAAEHADRRAFFALLGRALRGEALLEVAHAA